MTDEERTVLEAILIAEVLVLANQIEAKQSAKGVTRIGGDYTHEAVSLITDKRRDVMRLFQR